jgi:hypothetical protein
MDRSEKTRENQPSDKDLMVFIINSKVFDSSQITRLADLIDRYPGMRERLVAIYESVGQVKQGVLLEELHDDVEAILRHEDISSL